MLVAGEAGIATTALVEHVLSGEGQPVPRGRAAGWQSAVYEVLAQVLTPAAADRAWRPVSGGGRASRADRAQG